MIVVELVHKLVLITIKITCFPGDNFTAKKLRKKRVVTVAPPNPCCWNTKQMKAMTMELTDKTIVTIGASSGIGEAAPLLFAAAGANVVLDARRNTELRA